ncbi:MAG: TonB-dependent receptor [Alcanivorax sp.]|nr:TonB-dependent receptor [Alcanivorax sp.]
MRSARLAPAATVLCAALIPVFALAQTDGSTSHDDANLARVEVTASRTGHLTDALPVGAIVLTAEDIRRMPVRSLADVLDSVAGVRASRLYGIGDSQSSIDLMGFGATATQNTLVLLNGRRLNDIDMGSVDFSAIPLAAIERVEILPGAGGVLYGNGASGGTINIITRDRYDQSVGVEASAGSFNTRGGSLWASQGNARTSGLLSVQALNSDGYRDNNALRQRTAFADLRHRLDDTTFYLTVQADKEELGFPGARLVDPSAGINESRDNPRGTNTPNDWADRDGYSIMPGLVIHMETMDFHLDASLRRKKQSAFFDDASFPFYTEAEIKGYGVTPRLNGRFATGPIRHQWTLGWDLYISEYETDNADSEANFPDPANKQTGDQRQEAWYGFLTSGITDSLSLSLGARSEKVEQDFSLASGLQDSQNDRLELYEGGLTYQPLDNFALFASAARTARVATFDESIFLVSGNLDPVTPQTGRVYTTGMRWRDGRQRSSITYWRARYDNEIIFIPGMGNVNLEDRTQRQGYTLNSQWRLDEDIWFTINGTLQTSEFDEGPFKGNQIPQIPRRSGYMQIDWDALPWLTISASQRYLGTRYYSDDNDNAQGRQDSYRWTDLAATARHRQFYIKGTVHNVQDRNVSDSGFYSAFNDNFSEYPLPGRYYLVAIGAEF